MSVFVQFYIVKGVQNSKTRHGWGNSLDTPNQGSTIVNETKRGIWRLKPSN